MKNPICLSTGCLHKVSKDRNERIKILSKFHPDGIEISFSNKEYLLNFELTKKNLNYLKTLKFKSIHAPWKDGGYRNDKESKEILDKTLKLYRKIDARNVVFHKDSIEDYDFVANYDFVSSLENDDWQKSNNGIDYFKNLLNENEKFKITFDLAHAISTETDIADFINYFKERIIEIHFSIIIKDLSGKYSPHTFLHQNDSKKIRELLKPLKKIFVPLVFESFILSMNDLDFIKKEMKYVKNS